MTLRDKFEARYPCPKSVYYNSEINEYTNSNLTNYSVECAEMWQLRWESYQAAMEDAVLPEMDVFDTEYGSYERGHRRGWNDYRDRLLSFTQEDDHE